MVFTIFRCVALSSVLWIYVALAMFNEPFVALRGTQWRDFVVSKDNGTKLNPTVNFLSMKNISISSQIKDDLDGIQVTLSGQNSTLNSTYLVVTHNSSVLGSGGRRLIETESNKHHSFLTANCDAQILGTAESVALEEMLVQVQANLRIVINQAKKGIASKYGFQALFKSASNSDQVVLIFKKIMTAADANNSPDQTPIKPLIICVATEMNDAKVTGMEALYKSCQDEPNWRAAQPKGSNIVTLCPSLWELPGVSPHGSCPTKDAIRGTITPNEAWLQLNQGDFCA